MDYRSNYDELRLKQILLNLEDKHKILKANIDHLKNEIEKREVLIDELTLERELELIKEQKEEKERAHEIKRSNPVVNSKHTKEIIPADRPELLTAFESLLYRAEYSSDFAQQVALIIRDISKTTEEITASIRL